MYYALEKDLEKLDALAVKHGLKTQQMMELAGFHILDLFSRLKIKKNQKFLSVIGKGNKGGDVLGASRHLINHGFKGEIILISKKVSSAAQDHLNLLKKMKVPISLFNKNTAKNKIKKADILIDGLIGYHLKGAPRDNFAELINLMNQSKNNIIAYDIPSGLSVEGRAYQPTVQAFATLSLGLAKKAFKTEMGQEYSGKIFLADIGVPEFIYKKINKNIEFPFSKNSLIRI
ncbi:MAG: NAD(P)H-hydrate epimerase [Patescibacteria group bacterium]|nr:NAD(P)H-hydrate epimerase [Patescibacteria group bacterium]